MSNFNFQSIVHTEFIVAFPGTSGSADTLYQVPVDPTVTREFIRMLEDTWRKLEVLEDWKTFDCSEQYPSTTSLILDINNPIATKIAQIYNAQNISPSSTAIDQAPKIDYYFVKFKDSNGETCLGVRRASQFKGSVQKTFMYYIDGQLKLVKDNLFKIDTDFDFIVFPDKICIYRPIQFERIAEVEKELIKIIPDVVKKVSSNVSCVNFEFMNAFAAKSSRARRLITAISHRTDVHNLDPNWLVKACQSSKIVINSIDGKIIPAEGHELALLQMLDRRRFIDPLVEHQPDSYLAPARTKV